MVYIAGVTLIVMIYEFTMLPGNEVFDPNDLYATLIVSAIASAVYFFIFLKRTWVEKFEEEDN